MLNLLKRPARVAGIIFAAGIVAAAAPGQMAAPGAVNYVEGQVRIDGQVITQKDIGSATLGAGHLLQTDNGKVEMLLTPGVFVRLGAQSAIRMVSPSLTDTRIEMVQGKAMMEVAEFEHENHIVVADGPANASIKKRGIYEFTANPPIARVFDGKATVQLGDRTDTISKGDEVALDASNPKLKSHGFDAKQTETADDLYAWSKLRADYTAQANMSAASTYMESGPGWYGAGWYWNPYFDQYAFLLGDGFLWDPFGYGFFSPAYFGAYAPYFGYGWYGRGWRGGWAGGHGIVAGRPGGAIVRGSAAGSAIGGGWRGGAAGGMHAGAPGVVGGGFHGGAPGGFHGGGFGGGFHGGGRR